MRFESPVTEGFRITNEDLTLPSGATIPAGAWTHLSWSAANLDPAAFDDSLTPNVERDPNPHTPSRAVSTAASALTSRGWS